MGHGHCGMSGGGAFAFDINPTVPFDADALCTEELISSMHRRYFFMHNLVECLEPSTQQVSISNTVYK